MSSYRIQGATGEWEVVIGLEVHAQVTSQSKLFSGAATEFGAEPNAQVSLVDAAMPGMLPVPNVECIRQAVRTGMAIEAQINKYSRFDRKNYFYADLPQGYQISQLYHPIVGEGQLTIEKDEKAGILSPKLTCAHRQRPGPMCANCARSCAMSDRVMVIWKKAPCAPMSMSLCASRARSWARGPKRKTSIRCAL